MRYREQPPPPPWRRWIECVWSMETGGPVPGYPVRPDGCLDILYSPGQGLRAVGAMTVEQRHDLPAAASTVAVRFHPGMSGAFLGVAPAELTDRLVPLAHLWGRRGRELEHRLNESRSPGETLGLLLASIPPPSAAPNPVQRAIEAIASTHGACDLEYAARQANLSPRQFRRRCLEESGLTPKHLSRVLRFRFACLLARRSAKPAWSAVAADAGYFDQAHLIRDFREFAGAAPMAVFSNTGADVSG